MYRMERTVYHVNAGADGLLKLHCAIEMMMDCCQFQERSEKAFTEWLKTNHVAVFLSSIQLRILRRPAFGEKLEVKVVIYDCRAFWGYRCITIRDEAGDLCMIANAIGAFFDFARGRAVKLSDAVVNMLTMDPAEPMDVPERKIAVPVSGGEIVEPEKVRPSRLDLNGHLTSSEYVAIAADRLPEDFAYDRVRIEFKHQTLPGETLTPERFLTTPETCLVVLRGEDALPHAVLEFAR